MKLNIEKYSDILSLYPSFVSHHFRKIFTEDTKAHAIKTILECFEILLNHLTFFALCQLIHLCKTNSNFVDTKLKEKVIGRLIHKFSLGSKVEIFRDLLTYFKNSGNEGIFLDFIKNKEESKDFFEKSSILVTFRNDIEHKKILLTDENEANYFSEFFPHLESLILDCTFFRNIKILLPIEIIRTNIKFLEFAGASQKPLIRRLENFNLLLESNKCYIGNLDGTIMIPAHPFWQYSLIKDEYLLLFEQFDDDKKVILFENFRGTSLIDKGAQLQVFLDAIQPLYPDYKYQSNPYLTGYNFFVLNHKFNLKLLSPDGDTKTKEEVSFIKVKYEDKNSTLQNDEDTLDDNEDTIPFSYHDAHNYPISDEIFNLNAIDEKGNDLSILYDIKSEGFRDFKIGMKKVLDFEEKGFIITSYFEPMLFSGFLEENKDYYEIDIEQPVKLLEFTFELIPDFEFESFEIKYLNNKEFPKKKIQNKKIEVNENGNSTFYLSIKEPVIGKTFIINFITKKTKYFNPNFTPKKDSFRTGLAVHVWLNEQSADEYEIFQENDGSMRIKPKENLI